MTPEWVAAFETLDLDPSPTDSSIREAAAELQTLSVEQFSAAAIEALTNSGLEPRATSVCTVRRRFKKNDGSASCRAWHFDVYVDSGRAIKRMDIWLCDDGVWATSTGAQVATWRRMTELERTEFSNDPQVRLIYGRARRAYTWLDNPHGQLNLGVV